MEIIYSGCIPETIRTDENGKFKIPLEAYDLLHEYTIMASPKAAFVPDIDLYSCGLSLKKPTSGEKISSYPYEVEINPCGRNVNVQYYCLDFATVGGCNLGYSEKFTGTTFYRQGCALARNGLLRTRWLPYMDDNGPRTLRPAEISKRCFSSAVEHPCSTV
ncbi:MAG: hypothetical protein WBH53_00025 [Limnochordia bacterium]